MFLVYNCGPTRGHGKITLCDTGWTGPNSELFLTQHANSYRPEAGMFIEAITFKKNAHTLASLGQTSECFCYLVSAQHSSHILSICCVLR